VASSRRATRSFLALMLWVAGALAFVAHLPELGVAIFVVIVVNAVFAFVQEYRAERAAERLRDLLPLKVTVIRDGAHIDIDAADVVLGDTVLLTGGDRVPADMRALGARSLMVDTSTLTGESVPSAISANETVFAGTSSPKGKPSPLSRRLERRRGLRGSQP